MTTISLSCLAGLLAAACLLLAWRLIRARRSLKQINGENRRLRTLVTLGSQEAAAELEHLRRLRHDLRHYLQIAQGQPDAASLAELSAQVLDRPMAYGENWVIDALVGYYQGQAEALGFQADLHLEVSSCQSCLLPDLCLVLSNLLENGLEALQREGGGWLRARCISTRGYISLVVGNTSTAPLRSVNGRYLSSKAAGRYGIGLATVHDIARKYGGRAEFSADGTQFRASVFLSCPAGAASETDDTAGQPQSAP